MRLTSKPLLVLAISAGTLAATATGATAGWGGYDGGGLKTVSYINNDRGTATNNADVNDNSSCFTPDQYDMQQFSDAGTANRNVHNDACSLGGNGNKRGADIGATFLATGTGFISACPDPDGNLTGGPQFRILKDTNGDGRNDACFQSAYQDRGALGVADVAGDFEYHARVNNTGQAGAQDVEWGMDRDANLRLDEFRGDKVKVDWSATGLTGSSYSW